MSRIMICIKKTDVNVTEEIFVPSFDKIPACGTLTLKMILFFIVVSLLAVCQITVLSHPVIAGTPDIKTGLWQYKTNIQGAGVVMPDLSRLPPEKREQYRKMLTEMQTKPRTIENKSCVTEEKIKKMDLFSQRPDSECKRSMQQNDAHTWFVKEHCVSAEHTEDMEYNFHITDRTKVEGSGYVTISQGAQSHKSMMQVSGHWVQNNCGDVK
jgi:Protein of unknown function (DUF3617)